MLKIRPLLYLIFLLLVSCQGRTRSFPIETRILLSAVDSARVPRELQELQQLPFVTGVTYISPEEALQLFVDDGNDDPRSVLKENPLPASYLVILDGSRFHRSDTMEFRKAVQERIRNYAEILIPMSLVREK